MDKLTKTFVDRISPPSTKPDGSATQTFYRDSALLGFGLRVGSGGTKTFFVEKRVNGRNIRSTIGKYGQLTPEQARREATRRLGEMSTGAEPNLEKRQRQLKQITLKEVFADFLNTRKDLKPGTVKTYEILFKGSISDWMNKRMIDITKDMIEKRHREIGQKTPAQANNVMRTLRAIFNYAIEVYEDPNGNPIISQNPIDRLSRSKAWYHVGRRQSILKPHQIKAWWQATLELNTEVTRDYLQFLLFTGLRKMEAATLSWDNVDFQDDTFLIPDTKNKLPHVLPITPMTKEILLRRQTQSTTNWVFRGKRPEDHIKEPRTAVKVVGEKSGVPFSLHDLRRTFITTAEGLDIPAYALKKLLNHKDPNDVTQGYIINDAGRLRIPMKRIEQALITVIHHDSTL
ncbi:tyrosine-type recombinase/integrase [Reinekea sp.]|jgi:integrase|uniref:tyrosine-type recombinase/integrase n=1 Tax=Reinekea sp. TaxID=1970455 RepID=UPI00398A46EC